VDDESLALTGDEAAIAFSFVLHYRPSDPVQYAVRANGVDHLLRSLADAQVREVLASEPVDALLTADRAAFLERVRAGVDAAARRLGLGVEVVSVLCRELHPPFDAVAAFRDAFSAREDRSSCSTRPSPTRTMSLPRSAGGRPAAQRRARLRAGARRPREGEAAASPAGLGRQGLAALTRERLFLETMGGPDRKRKIIASPKVNRGGYQLWLFAPDEAPSPVPDPKLRPGRRPASRRPRPCRARRTSHAQVPSPSPCSPSPPSPPPRHSGGQGDGDRRRQPVRAHREGRRPGRALLKWPDPSSRRCGRPRLQPLDLPHAGS
jgi:regulator of protease activity HflC (stomatin/prohibitin superfamily)